MNRIQLFARTLGAVALVAWTAPALAQDNPECLGTDCGKPKEEGGGGGGGWRTVWVAYTDDGDTLAYTDDADARRQGRPRRQLPLRLQPRSGGQ